MVRVHSGILLTILVVVASTAAPAQAQWVGTPYLAINTSGDVQAGKGGIGGSVGYFGGRLGLEFDVARYQHFFRDADLSHLVADPRTDLD